jgi:hypothetical protein
LFKIKTSIILSIYAYNRRNTKQQLTKKYKILAFMSIELKRRFNIEIIKTFETLRRVKEKTK